MEQAIMLAMISIPFILVYIANSLNEKHIFLKVLLFFFSFFDLFIIGGYVADPNNTDIYLTFYNFIITIVYTFASYVFLYFIYSIFDYMGKIPQIKPKFKRGWGK